jgi:hypothetical protein
MEVTLGIWVNQRLSAARRNGARQRVSVRLARRCGRRRPRRRYDDGGYDVGAGAGQDRQRVTVAEVEGKARGARTDQGAERHAGVENADNAADIAAAEPEPTASAIATPVERASSLVLGAIVTGLIVTGFAALFFDQMNAFDADAALHRLDHVVDR